MFPGINPAMISYLVKGKLDEIINGSIPDGFKEKERTKEKIVLVPTEGEFMEGIKFKALNCAIIYNNVEIVLQNEETV